MKAVIELLKASRGQLTPIDGETMVEYVQRTGAAAALVEVVIDTIEKIGGQQVKAINDALLAPGFRKEGECSECYLDRFEAETISTDVQLLASTLGVSL